jgi:glucose/arabinose dehydrogenase
MAPHRFWIAALTASLLLTACSATPASPISTLAPPAATPTSSPPGPSPTPLPIPASPTLAPSPSPQALSSVSALPDPAGYTWQLVASGLDRPTDLQPSGDGSGGLFVLEQIGRIRILAGGQLLPAPLLDITDRVGSDGSEQGLLGLALHPNFGSNGWIYVNYTDRNGDTHLARFTVHGSTADPASEKQLLLIRQPFANHNGGSLAFGPDGYLYAGLGDGGSGGDPYGNAQSGNTLLGKILRLDVDHGDPYAIPATNPFAVGGAAPEIWALGLRNPWRFTFDRLTGDLWIGDVGQNTWEEINFVPANTPGGLNFGWNWMEATHPYQGDPSGQFTPPLAEYSHAQGCSVTGGVVYRGLALPAWQGVYLFGDFCSGTVWGLLNSSGAQPLFQTGFRLSTFGQDEAGEVYLADYGSGSVYQLVSQAE